MFHPQATRTRGPKNPCYRCNPCGTKHKQVLSVPMFYLVSHKNYLRLYLLYLLYLLFSPLQYFVFPQNNNIIFKKQHIQPIQQIQLQNVSVTNFIATLLTPYGCICCTCCICCLKKQPYCLLSKKENNLYNLYNFIQPQNVSGRQPRLFWLYMLYVLS